MSSTSTFTFTGVKTKLKYAENFEFVQCKKFFGRWWKLRLSISQASDESQQEIDFTLELQDVDTDHKWDNNALMFDMSLKIKTQNQEVINDYAVNSKRPRYLQINRNCHASIHLIKTISLRKLLHSYTAYCKDDKLFVEVTMSCESQLYGFASGLQTSPLSDATLKVNDTFFSVHKWLLSAHSPVFKAMFESEMAESATNKIVITDFSEEVVRAMLQCIYDPTATDNLLCEHDLQLLMIAHKYQVHGLVAQGEQYIAQITVSSNAVSMLQFGDLYNCEVSLEFLICVLLGLNCNSNDCCFPGD
jgi:hypothetical protein